MVHSAILLPLRPRTRRHHRLDTRLAPYMVCSSSLAPRHSHSHSLTILCGPGLCRRRLIERKAEPSERVILALGVGDYVVECWLHLRKLFVGNKRQRVLYGPNPLYRNLSHMVPTSNRRMHFLHASGNYPFSPLYHCALCGIVPCLPDNLPNLYVYRATAAER
jgi:hypothetical protein